MNTVVSRGVGNSEILLYVDAFSEGGGAVVGDFLIYCLVFNPLAAISVYICMSRFICAKINELTLHLKIPKNTPKRRGLRKISNSIRSLKSMHQM